MPTSAPPAAKPSKHIFDPFNSSATGHQRAENRLSGSTSWRDSRNLKLRQQFSGGSGGGKRVSDTVGAGSLDFGLDGRTENGGWEKGAKGLRKDGQRSILENVTVEKDEERPTKKIKLEEPTSTSVVNPFTPFRREDGKIRESSWTSHEFSPSELLEPIDPATSSPDVKQETQVERQPRKGLDEVEEEEDNQPPRVLKNCTFYINGSTAPISDHKLKHLIAAQGGNMSISLGRRTVTHVIIGKPNGHGGCGGGLASSKIQKEIASLRGNSVKFITADWVIESAKAGKRLPESRFEAMKIAPKGVANISTMFKPKEKK